MAVFIKKLTKETLAKQYDYQDGILEVGIVIDTKTGKVALLQSKPIEFHSSIGFILTGFASEKELEQAVKTNPTVVEHIVGGMFRIDLGGIQTVFLGWSTFESMYAVHHSSDTLKKAENIFRAVTQEGNIPLLPSAEFILRRK